VSLAEAVSGSDSTVESICVESGRASEALRGGASSRGASDGGSAMGRLGGSLLGGVDGLHWSMIVGAACSDRDEVAGEEGPLLVGGAGTLRGLANHGRAERP
jgi:hypothetical protein